MASNKVEIEVKANVTGQESVSTLGDALDSAGKAARKMGTDAAGASGGMGQADTAAKGLAASAGKLGTGMDAAAVQIAKAKNELLALVGVGAGLQGVKDLATLADGYKNLEARIKLVTGEGKAFDTAFQGVFDVAKRTNSAVEETGLLFAKLAEAGKALGVSQAEALKLTETINQSIQLSGASAEASKAAIIQLVQGLQSGVVRGDEFNSIMEQSPRLAKALADGLSVGTGELRKMAEAGQLTSATVIKALQGQSDAVATEFGKLPATVGRAMTNLTTAFTAYVGEADKAGGYTAKLAGVIDSLAGNLSTVATVMIHTGQVMGAMKLLSMAQDWLTASAAIKATAASTELATAATVQGTAAKTASTAATVANTVAQRANAAAWNDVAAKLGGVGPQLGNTTAQASAAAGAFGAVTGAVGGLMRAIAPLLAIDIALHFKQYGTAIGEFAARLFGAKDKTLELTAAEKAATEQAALNATARKQQAAALKEATERTFGLTKEGSALIVKFDELRTKGDSASEAIKSIGKDFDLSTVPGIRTAASVLDKLLAEGKLTATEFQAAWSDALKGQDLALFAARFKQGMEQLKAEAKAAGDALAVALAKGLSGAELKPFEDKARQALAAVGNEAKRLEQIVGAQLQEAIKRSGLDMAVLSGGMGKAAASAINDTEAIIAGLDRLKAQGINTEQVLAASIGKGIDTADSQAAINAVTAQITALGQSGQLNKVAVDALLDSAKVKAGELATALAQATPGFADLAKAAKAAGVDVGELTTGLSKGFKDSIVQIDNLAKAITAAGVSAEKASPQLAGALDVRLAAAKTREEIDLIIAEYRKLADQGLITGDALKEGLARAQGKADEMTKGVNSIAEAYKQLGLKTPEELNKIATANAQAWDKIKGDANASVDTLKAAFTTYAQSAIAAAGSVGSEQRRATEELLKQEAAAKGLTVAFDAEGKMVVQTQAEAAAALAKTTAEMEAQKNAVDSTTLALEAQNKVLERSIDAKEKANDLAERAIALENKRLGKDAEGFAINRATGERIVETQETERSTYERAKSQGLTDAQALKIAAEFFRDGRPTNFGDADFAQGENWLTKLQKAIDQMVLDNAREKAGDSRFANRDTAQPQGQQPPQGLPQPQGQQQNQQTQQQQAEQAQQAAAAAAEALSRAQSRAVPPPAPQRAQEVRKSDAQSLGGEGKAGLGGDGDGKRGLGSSTNLTINVSAGVNMANREQVGLLARAIMPAINDLQRKGALSGR